MVYNGILNALEAFEHASKTLSKVQAPENVEANKSELEIALTINDVKYITKYVSISCLNEGDIDSRFLDDIEQ